MPGAKRYLPAALALFAAILGLVFAGLSSLDYTRHLDRQVHDIHCSYVPGLGAEASPDNACRVAMYSPFAALFRDRYWGGVPISLFAVGAFSFFAAFALYVLLAGPRVRPRALYFLAVFGATPLLVSLLMAAISALKLGHFCKTCVGIYASSALLAAAGIAAVIQAQRSADDRQRGATAGDAASPPVGYRSSPDALRPGSPPEDAPWILVAGWAIGLALFTVTPALIYVSALPNFSSYITGCGKLEKPTEPTNALLHVQMPGGTQPATLFVDPLCPTCKAFHQRLATEGLLDQLDITLVLFPLDSECNWMLDRPVHPGSCVVSRAIICSKARPLQVLEWAYDHQEEILGAAKAGAGLVNVRAMIHDHFPGIDTCMDAKETSQRQDRMLRYIIDNHLPVSTPQLFLGETRLCDEDTDMGLSYTMRKLLPGLRAK
jgi:uncharacterized membrane protein